MKQVLYRKEFNHIRLGKQFKLLLKLCMGRKSLRYAIDGVKIDEDGFTATNRRLLFNYADKEHGMESGVYHITSEGFGLAEIEIADNFPKWQDVVPKETKLKKVHSLPYLDGQFSSEVIYYLNRNDVNFRVAWTMQVLERLELLHASDLVVFAHKDEPHKCPLVINGIIQDKHFTYVQMPIIPRRDA